MAALVEAFPEHNLHVIDLPYRLCSWALDEPANIGLWFSAQGELRAWAVMQTPFWCIDFVLHPAEQALYPRLLAWAEQRATALVTSHFGRPAWFVHVPGGPTRPKTPQPALEAAGFVPQADLAENPWSMVFMQYAGQHLPDSKSPAGFSIRPLEGQSEVEGYVACHQAAFQSDNMRSGWRTRTLSHPAYQPDLDLVAVDAAGRVAGFCIGWLNAQGGQIEPMGVHPDFRGRGLGRALLSELVRRLQSRVPDRIFVATDDFRDAAFALYKSIGFRVIEPVWVYRKDWK
jgi:ribosomal protein S18 acetylase RimI-like enzyme